MDRQSPEVIEEQMRVTRTSLQAKLAAAEEKVTSTVRQAGASVESAAQTVKDTVDDSLGKVRDTMGAAADEVRHLFDLRSQVRDHPWAAVGGAAGVGLIAALLIPRSGRTPAPLPQTLAGFVAPTQASRPAPPAPASAAGESWLGEVLDLAKREAKGFAETLIRSFSSALQDKVTEASPQLIQDALAAAVPGFAANGNGHHAEPPFARRSYASSIP